MLGSPKATVSYLGGIQQFHLSNQFISYIFCISEDGKLLQIHYGKKVPQNMDYTNWIEKQHRALAVNRSNKDLSYSLEHLKQEFPEYGTTDFRHPAIQLKQENGSRLTEFCFHSYEIIEGKKELEDLPASYVEENSEAKTLIITLIDKVINVKVELSYTIFADLPVIARSNRVINEGKTELKLEHLASLSLDLPDMAYEWLQLSGAWGRERHVKQRELQHGIQAIESTRGTSSPNQNPFVALKRHNATENSGEVIGATLIYSGNFLIQAEVDTYDVTRLQLGINPFQFEWHLKPCQTFTTPEAILVYSDSGINGMSQSFHQLLRKRVARGVWRDKNRPVLINNWEATYFDFDEDKIIEIAQKAKEVGVELFVLDDGWFGQRVNDQAGLGDWYANQSRLPNGIGSVAKKIHEMGMLFGLWFEPEMVNKDSNLYRKHPDWILATPNREHYEGRKQSVLNFGNPAVVENIFKQMCLIIEESKLDYIKWDMNRLLTSVYDVNLSENQQGEVFHRYVLGVYQLYDKLIQKYPNVLFESCASGGGRFDAGMLYYAPQAWTSDDTDAIERIKIQYGTSFVYPISSMGAHVSCIPNHQTNRNTPLETRGNVAYFGAFGYELDLNTLTDEEINIVKSQIAFYKANQAVIHNGKFYRLISPFDGNRNQACWSVVSEDKKTLVLAYYKMMNEVMKPYQRIKLQGLNPEWQYRLDNQIYSGEALMNIGFILSDSSSGQIINESLSPTFDYDSKVWILEKVNN